MNRRPFAKRVAVVACAAALCFAALGIAAGCSSSPGSNNNSNASATRSFTDSCGRTVELPAKVERVAVAGTISQQVFLTFAPDTMVGLAIQIDPEVSKYIGEKYSSLPVYGQIYGGKGDLNKEAVASANPQVIVDIGEGKGTIKDDMDKLQEQLGIPCVHIEATLDTYDQTYTMLGELMSMQDKGKTMADYCKKAYDTTVAGLAKVDIKVKGLYVVGLEGLSVIAKGSYQSQVVDMVIVNLAVLDNPSAKGTGNEVSMEQIALWNPDLVVCEESLYNDVQNKPEWADVSAIKTGNYYKVPAVPYNWLSTPPSVNQILGMQWFSRLVYPDKFNDNVKDIVQEYYKLFYNYTMSDSEYATFMEGSLPK